MKIGRPRRDKCGQRASSRPVAMVRAVAAACVGTRRQRGWAASGDGLAVKERNTIHAQRDRVGDACGSVKRSAQEAWRRDCFWGRCECGAGGGVNRREMKTGADRQGSGRVVKDGAKVVPSLAGRRTRPTDPA
jgi:hypothetical protein